MGCRPRLIFAPPQRAEKRLTLKVKSKSALKVIWLTMGKAIGIDLGTTNSCVACMEADDPTVLQNAEGGRTTPSVVAFTESGERLIGTVAKRQAVINPERTVFSIKRFMGRQMSEVDKEETIVPYHVISDESGGAMVELPAAEGESSKQFSPPEISAMILQKLRSDAEERLGEEVTHAVITVPAYFNDDQRQATKDAGRIAGLEVMRIINEPTAAALAYGLESAADEEKILVFDLGGGTFDVSILEINDGVFEVLATAGDNRLGGDDWDAAIVDWMVIEFKRDQGVDLSIDKSALQRLYEAAEKAKIELSSVKETQINLPFITAVEGQPKHLDLKLSRTRMNQLTEELLERITGPLHDVIADAGVDVDHVILVGGMSRVPAVVSKVTEITSHSPRHGVNPDEVVALGAAIQAGVLSGEVSEILLLDVTPLTLGIETKGGVMSRLIERNTTIPTTRSEIFSTAEDAQSKVEVHVLQGEREIASGNKSLGRFQLTGIPPAPQGVPQIQVEFDIDADGLIHVSARDLGTGKEQRIEVTGAGGLSDEEVERMISEAEEHAEEDRKAKELAVARNNLEAVVWEAEKQIKDLPLDESERARIDRALSEAEAAMSSESATRMREVKADIEQAFYSASERIYKTSESDPINQAEDVGEPQTQPAYDPSDDVEVVDAEVVDEVD